MAVPFTVTKYAGNPILTPDGTGQDAAAVRDACFVKTSDGTYNIIYTGFADGAPMDYWANGMLATSSAHTGSYTRLGTIFPIGTTGTDLLATTSDPFMLWDGTIWHAWCSIVPAGLADVNSQRQIGHLTAAGTGASVPTTGWAFDTIAAVIGKTTGWTSDGAGTIAGVAAPKVYPATGGGWIMFLAGWGYSAVNQYQVGYATASSLDGPWTLNDTPLFGTPGGYQSEQIIYVYANGKHYAICNRLGLNGKGGVGWPTLGIDLWEADSQTGPYTLVQFDIIPKGGFGFWDSEDMGVTGLEGWNLDITGDLRGVYDANDSGGASIIRSIGAVTLTATYDFRPPVIYFSAQPTVQSTTSDGGVIEYDTITLGAIQTQASQTQSATGTLSLSGTVSQTQAKDTQAISGLLSLSGTVSQTQAAQVQVASAPGLTLRYTQQPTVIDGIIYYGTEEITGAIFNPAWAAHSNTIIQGVFI